MLVLRKTWHASFYNEAYYEIEEAFELHERLGLYKIWLNFQKQYFGLLPKSLSPLLKLVQPLEADFFKQEAVTA